MARRLKSSWIVEHATGLAPLSSAPEQFHIWAAISVIGAVLKNNIYIKYATYTIYPNQFIVLTAPPGIGKGTAIHAAFEYVKSPDLVNIISDRVTAPKIIDRMAQGFAGTPQINTNGTISVTKDCSAILFSPELSTLLGASDWMLTFLCDAWDRGEYTYDTKGSGTSIVKGLCCSLVGGCVPDYIRRLNKDAMAAISGGFTARTIFVYADKISKHIAWPVALDATAKGRQLMDDLKHDIQQISYLKGEVKFNDSAKSAFTKFYTHKDINPKDDDSDVVLHFKSRIHVHVFKLSMIFSASRTDSLIIEEEDVLNAIRCVKSVLDNLNKTFRGVGESDLAEATSRVQSFIERKGYTTRNEILANTHRHVSPENLTRILALLESIQFISVKYQSGSAVIKHIDKTKSNGGTP